MEDKVIVYIIRDEHHEDHRSKVKSIFHSDHFIIEMPEIPLNEDLGSERREAYQVGWSLSDAKEKYKNYPVLILKDSSLCVADKFTVYDVIFSSLKSGKFHVFYLCKWNDKCHLYSRKQKVKGSNSHIVKTQSPYGIQALLFTPEGRDVIIGSKPMKNGEFFRARNSLSKSLNKNIAKGYIDAFCVVPNLIAYDIGLASDDKDFLKLNECAPILRFNSETNGAVNVYIAVIIIFILLVIIIWAAIVVYPRS